MRRVRGLHLEEQTMALPGTGTTGHEHSVIVPLSGSHRRAHVRGPGDRQHPPAGVSGEAWAGIQEQIEAERHRITESDRPGRLYRADNPVQRFTAHFGAEDVVIAPRGRGEPAWELGLRLTAWGAAHDLQPVRVRNRHRRGQPRRVPPRPPHRVVRQHHHGPRTGLHHRGAARRRHHRARPRDDARRRPHAASSPRAAGRHLPPRGPTAYAHLLRPHGLG